MTNLEIGLITFIATIIFLTICLSSDHFLINKDLVEKSKLIMFEDGSLWKKVEFEVQNDNRD